MMVMIFTYELMDSRISAFNINNTVFLDIILLLYNIFLRHSMNCTGLTAATAFLSHSLCYHALETQRFCFK
jgi:hypothetical protein